MQEMIEAQPELARAILRDGRATGTLAAEVAEAVRNGGRVTVTGCGTSENAAMAVAVLLGEALFQRGVQRGTVVARQAFEAALEPWPPGLVLGISHEGTTPATVAALRAAREAGARTALITANGSGPAASLVDARVVTPLIDRSWCHTVGYLSPLLAGAGVAASLSGAPLDAARVAAILAQVLAQSDAIAVVANALGAASRFVTVGSGVDAVGARELALKIEEGVRLPAVARDTETELHGHLVSATPEAAFIAIVADPRATAPRAQRATQLLLAAHRLHMPTAAVVSAAADALVPAQATSAGRIVLPAVSGADSVTSVAEAALATGIALQLLALALLTHHRRNPDLIGREQADQREGAEIASSSFPL